MKLAINYSPQAAALARSEDVAMDLFKCPSPGDPDLQEYAERLISEAQAVAPVYVHFPLNTGDSTITDASMALVGQILEETGTPYVNIHLTAENAAFPDTPVDDRGFKVREKVIQSMISDVLRLTQRFGPDRVIAENVVYRGPSGRCMAAAVLPEVISAVVERTGCGLLLDTAHARLSANSLGISAMDYISALPVAMLTELHVTGARLSGKPAYDSMPLEEDDWQIVEWVLDHIHVGEWPQPWVVALEYGGLGPIFEWRSEPAVIAEHLPRLRRLILSNPAIKL